MTIRPQFLPFLAGVVLASSVQAQVRVVGPAAPIPIPRSNAPQFSTNPGALASIAGTGNSAPVATVRAKYEPAGNAVYHGAGLPEFWSENGLNQQLRAYAGAAGKRTSVITWFASTYENGVLTNWRQNYAHNLNRVKRLGAGSLIKFSTQDYAFNRTRKQADLKAIAAGTWDGYFREFAGAIRDFGSPVFISIDHEMNGNWYPYSQEYPGSGVTSQDFIAAWRRIVLLFRQTGANNAAFVWSPNVPDIGRVSFRDFYPGDEYTDWIGVSFYSGNDAYGMDNIYRAYAAKKPFFITEWATGDDQNRYNPRFPGEVEWVRQFFAALNTRYPRIKAISWFNYDKAKDGEADYRLQRLQPQASTYAQDVAGARYLDRAPELVGQNPSGGLAPLEKPGNEVIFVEKPRLDTPPPAAPPVQNVPRQRSLLERVKIEIAPVAR